MKRIARTYPAELAALDEAYDLARRADIAELSGALEMLNGGPCVFVASGGALAVAELGAALHTRTTGQLAVAWTPVTLARQAPSLDTGLVFITASGRHPDVRSSMRWVAEHGYRRVMVVTLAERGKLHSSFGAARATICSLSFGLRSSSFLATCNVLFMSACLIRAAGYELQAELASHSATGAWRPHLLIVHDASSRPAAVDLETRVHELGLGPAQVCDFRNLAHGRHFGLARQLADTTVVAMWGPESAGLAERTLGALPETVHRKEVVASAAWPQSVLQHLHASMHLVHRPAETQGVNPSRPGAPDFGRALYHMGTKLPAQPQPAAVQFKRGHGGSRAGLRKALAQWLTAARSAKVEGVVLDYDGTVCATEAREAPPPPAVQAEIVRLVRCTNVAFASGRGPSLHQDLRKWVPEEFWQDITVGMYNGGLVVTLADDVSRYHDCPPALMELARSIERTGLVDRVERRRFQLTVSAVGSPLGLARALTERLGPSLEGFKLFGSGHSVDVVPAATSKTAVLGRVASSPGAAIAIGDQGQLGGNDFELLHATPLSLSVDRCSGDPTRCWRLGRAKLYGPALTVKYLAALQPSSSGLRFRWRGT